MDMHSDDMDRVSAIHHHISLWRVNDSNLEDITGFLNYLKSCDIGSYPVQDTTKWLSLIQESKKLKVGVAAVIFMHRKLLLGKEIHIERSKDRASPGNVFVVGEEQRKELEEMSERLKRDDPVRRKRNS
jgi:hypothetical protein